MGQVGSHLLRSHLVQLLQMELKVASLCEHMGVAAANLYKAPSRQPSPVGFVVVLSQLEPSLKLRGACATNLLASCRFEMDIHLMLDDVVCFAKHLTALVAWDLSRRNMLLVSLSGDQGKN